MVLNSRFDDGIFLVSNCSYHIYILYFDRIDVSEGIYVNKTNELRSCIISTSSSEQF